MGLGLIGGSLGMRLRSLGRHVLGIDVDPAVARRARERGAADETSTELAAVRDAEVVVVAVPLDRIVAVAQEAAERAAKDAILTDVGSVKGPIVARLAGLERVRFVGGHPMFGTEGWGIEAAEAALLDRHPYVLTPVASTDGEALETLGGLVQELGMRPVVLAPDMHDRLVAQVSHLPYLLAMALIASVEREAREVAGPAFRDATRVVQSPLGLWEEIVRENRAHILAALDRFGAALAAVRQGVERGEVIRVQESGEAAAHGETTR